MARRHERGVSLWALVRASEDEVDVRTFFNFFVDEFDVVAHNGVEELFGFSRRLDDVFSCGFGVVVGVVRSLAVIPLRLVRLLHLRLALRHDFERHLVGP